MAKLLLTAAVSACLLLGGCASTSAPRSGNAVAAFQDSIELSGRLSVNYSKDGKPEALSGKFNWRQRPGRIDVSLASPLGQTIATISVTPQQASLTEAGKPPRVAADIDTLSAQALGWSLPVSGLRDWLQGYASAADGSRFVATPARDSVTTRDGWRLRYVSWQDEGAAVPQPKRIDAERQGGGEVEEMTIRIVIDPAAPAS